MKGLFVNVNAFKSAAIRRRGTTIAAAALSVAMVGSFVHPVIAPQSAAVANAATTPTIAAPDEAPGSSVATAIDADAITSDPSTRGHLKDWMSIDDIQWGNDEQGGARVTGYAVLLNNSLSATNGGSNTPVPAGTPVYMQWIDKDNMVSPIYKAVTHDGFTTAKPGAYAFALPTWTDSNGKVHSFKPGVVNNPRIRVWFEPFTDPRTNSQVVLMRNANRNPGFMDAEYGAGSTVLSSNHINNYTLFGYTYPLTNFTTPESEWKKSEEQPTYDNWFQSK